MSGRGLAQVAALPRAIGQLIRLIPVAAWSLAGLAIGAGAALRNAGTKGSRIGEIGWMVAGSVLIQGCLAHAVNDVVDDRSGTDSLSPGILSGGSRVIQRGLATSPELVVISVLALGSALIVGRHFAARSGWEAWLILGVGVWSALAYSLPPFSLSYRPLAGEWLAAWPAAFTCASGSYFLLSGHVTPNIIAAASLHATASVAWLAQHHIPDVAADWAAVPRKRTTVAWVVHRFEEASARTVPAAYFAAAAGLAAAFAIRTAGSSPLVFLVPASLSSAGVLLALFQTPGSLRSQTATELGMIALALVQAVWLAARLRA